MVVAEVVAVSAAAAGGARMGSGANGSEICGSEVTLENPAKLSTCVHTGRSNRNSKQKRPK